MEYHFGHQASTPTAQPAPGYGPQSPAQLAGLEQFDLRLDLPPPQRRERTRTRQRTRYRGGARGHVPQFPAKRTGPRTSQVLLASVLLASVIVFGARQVLQKRAAAAALKKGGTQQQVAQARAHKTVRKATAAAPAPEAEAEAAIKAATHIPWLQFAAQYWPVLISLYSPILALVVSFVTFTLNYVNRGGRDVDLNIGAYMPLFRTASRAFNSAWSKIDQELRGGSEDDEDE